MIRDASFDGAGVRVVDPAFARQVTGFLRAHGMIWQAQCYPQSVDALKLVLEVVAELRNWVRITSICSPICGRCGWSRASLCWNAGAGLRQRPG